MKLVKSLLLAIMFFETTCKGKLTRRQAHKLRSLKKRVNSARTLALENQITKIQNLDGQRQLQKYDGQFVEIVQERCPDELAAALADPKDAVALEDLITCIKDTFNELFVDCFNDVPALQPAAQCFLDLGFDNLFLEARDQADSDSDSDSDDDDDEVEEYEPAKPLDLDELLKFDDLFDVDDLDLKFKELDNIDVANLDAEQCDDIFGTENNPEVFACLLLIEPGDIDDFDDFLEDEVDNSAACQALAEFAGEDEASEFLDDVLFDNAEELFDEELGLSDQAVAEEKLDQITAAIEACSEFDDGTLQNILASFQSAGSTLKTSLMSAAFAMLAGLALN